MKLEEACVQGIYYQVVQEKALLDTILEDCCSDRGSDSHSQHTGARSVVSVPRIDAVVSEADVLQHRQRMEALQSEIEHVDRAAKIQADRVKDRYAAALDASARAWEQTIGDVTRKLQATEAAFKRVRSEAEARFRRDSHEIEHLRANEIRQVAEACAGAPEEKPPPRAHHAQQTRLVTKVMVPQRYEQLADAVLRWLERSGQQARHAAGNAFDLGAGDGRPTVLVRASKRDLDALETMLVSTPAAMWPSLRESVARMLSTMTHMGDDGV